MRVRDGDDDRTILSKKLSYVLRHGAKMLDLDISDGGWVSVKHLLACEALFGGVAVEELKEVVDQSNRAKQRYELEEAEDDWLIRATGKHTMQGLQAAAKVEKKNRRSSGGGGGGGRGEGRQGGGGRGERPVRQPQQHLTADKVTEDDFCAKWRLDFLARMRLNELPAASRQLAMQRFSPGPQVPPADFPKVFVAFCKRFRSNKSGGKDDDGSGLVDLEEYSQQEVGGVEQASRAGTASRGGAGGVAAEGATRSKKKPGGKGKGWDDEAAPAEAAGAPCPSGSDMGASSRGAAEPWPAYPSPGSSPRSPGGTFGNDCGVGACGGGCGGGGCGGGVCGGGGCSGGGCLGGGCGGGSCGGGCPPQGLPLQALGPVHRSLGNPQPTSSPLRQRKPAMPAAPHCAPRLHGAQMQPPAAPPPPAYPPQGVPLLQGGGYQRPPPPTHAPQVPGLVQAYDCSGVQHGSYQEVGYRDAYQDNYQAAVSNPGQGQGQSGCWSLAQPGCCGGGYEGADLAAQQQQQGGYHGGLGGGTLQRYSEGLASSHGGGQQVHGMLMGQVGYRGGGVEQRRPPLGNNWVPAGACY